MSSFISAFNSTEKPVVIKVKTLKTLKVDRQYRIEALEKKYCPKPETELVLATLADPIANEKFKLWLPKNYSHSLTSDHLHQINSKSIKANLIYKGIVDGSPSFLCESV